MAAPCDKSEIIDFFLVEAGEHIQNLNAGLLALEKDPVNRATIDELFRAAHTLKGSAAMMGFQGVSDVAHKAEDMLGQFRSGSAPTPGAVRHRLYTTPTARETCFAAISAKNPED